MPRRFAVVPVVTLVSLGAWGLSTTRAVEPPATQASAAPPVGPVTYFIDNCARCHGEIGSPYVGVKSPKRGEALNAVLIEMAEGPAQSPLDEPGLADQRKLHDAIYDAQPFVWLTPDRAAGETLPDTKLVLTADGKTTPIEIKDNRFTLPARAGTLRAERNGKTTDLPLR